MFKALLSLIIATILTSFESNVFSQDMEDVVYLKNGSVIHGTIIEQIPNESIKIKTKDGNIFVYNMEEIEKMTREEIKKKTDYEETDDDVTAVTKYRGRPIGNGILFNPLGFLQFGPVINGEFKIAANSVIGPQVRFTGLGLLSHLVAFGSDAEELDVSSMAVGIAFKHLFDNRSSPNRFYLCGMFEYGWGSTKGDIGEAWEWKGTHSYWDVLVNAGYRWRFQSKFFLNVGLMTGVMNQINSEWEYTKPTYYKYGIKYEDPSLTLFLIMAELSFGWEF